MTQVRDQLDEAEAELERMAAGRDVMFEKYPGGGGRYWMTSGQLKNAALRLTMKTRLSGSDPKTGRSDPGTDAACVADAYLHHVVSYQESADLIRRSAKLLEANPYSEAELSALKAADALIKEGCDHTDSNVAVILEEGFKVARSRMNREVNRPQVDFSKLKMLPTIQLASGAYYDFVNPHRTPLSIDDMAAGLSRICRYTGQLAIDEDDIYSVAQHSVLASENCDEDCDPYEALLHDKFESVGNDMASPFKQLLLDYKEYEDRSEQALSDYYGTPHPMSDACKRIDIRMLATEKRDLMPADVEGDETWALIQNVTPLPFVIEPWGPAEARHRFLHRFYWLTEGRLPKPQDKYSRPHPNAPADWIEALRKAWGGDPFKLGAGKVGMHPDLRRRLEACA